MKESVKRSRKPKNLLVISSGFPDKSDKNYIAIFVKQQVLALSRYFDNIYVFAPYPHNPKLIARISGLQPSNDFKNYRQKNIHIFFPKYFDVPGKYSDGHRARRWYKMISRLIDDKKLKFDAIHGHFTYPGGKVAQLISRRYEKPYFVTVHENQDWLKKELNMPLMDRTNEIWRNAHKVFFVNKIEARKLHRRYDNIEWLPNGIDTKRFRPMASGLSLRETKQSNEILRQKLHLPLDKKILLSVGSLIPVKNHQLLIKSVAVLAKKNPNIYCIIIGTGNEKHQLQNLIKKLSLEKHVKTLGHIPNKQLPLWYNACDVYCVTSHHESFGITQIEAMACGKPVVATRNGSSETIIPGYCGIITKKDTVKENTKNILLIINKQWNNKKIRQYSRKFSINQIALKSAKIIYKEINTKK